MTRAVFLDKDGTLVEDVPYSCDVNLIRLMRGVPAGLRRLEAAGYALIIVSNQSGLAHGMFNLEALTSVEFKLRSLLAEVHVRLNGFYYCPHHPDGRISAYTVICDCRKPSPGLLVRAASDRAINLNQSWMVGDILHDVEAGRRAGCRTILLDNGHETEWRLGTYRWPDYFATDLNMAADIILAVDSGATLADIAGSCADGARYVC